MGFPSPIHEAFKNKESTMKNVRITTLLLSGLLASAALPALADNSTGPTNPGQGTAPSSVGVPTGTGTNLPNGNTDGSATPRDGTSTQIKPQNTGNPEGSSMGGAVTKPDAGSHDMGDGTGSEGGAKK